MKKIGMIGGDLRNRYLKDLFEKNGYEVVTYGLEEIKDARLSDVFEKSEYIVAGTPFTRDNRSIEAPFSKEEILIEDVVKNVSGRKILFAGSINHEIKELLRNSNIEHYDFLDDERTTVLNIIPTVEGAVELAIRKTDYTLFGSNILVIGYGRIGKYLSKILRSLGAEVTVSARKEADLTWIELDGNKMISYEDFATKLNDFDIVFNTVPYLIVKEKEIKLLKKSCRIIDLASKPGGIDFECAEKYGIDAELALGLPGKTAPKSAAGYMFEFFEKCINN